MMPVLPHPCSPRLLTGFDLSYINFASFQPLPQLQHDSYKTTCPAQDSVKPAVLRNRGNEYLHYEDDWYILGFKPDKYALIYYKGNNDAWQGYGGATVYTKCA